MTKIIDAEWMEGMAEVRLDCRGLACPNPVLKTRELIDRGDVERLTVVVDNEAAGENVRRFLVRSGYQVQSERNGEDIAVSGSRSQQAVCEIALPETAEKSEQKVLVLVGADRLGRGDDELGTKLMISFLGTLKEMGSSLWRLVLLNSGVKLAVEDSAALPALQELEQEGIGILVCGTCLNHFELLERKKVGETTNMLDIVTSMQLADRVISMT
ncbi:sulfurtransferase-like selenium metabolism protein YedF [Desulfoferrobacter suflitae]|uniref:sulfurtransferase-like selenium metabolism protein YedF n=1 Tax=Desulfoferrobacter suflitae TaxID=2865782 RepID=UPI0021648DF0|nr:sulfurtransferase-like selenium metabolism protein YedF [Desulfoferrobacter suflitae]MCK8603409.1 sulfurtransferase-like selenium metabolism protein YedF [Desulfoferrobacter suflitae]